MATIVPSTITARISGSNAHSGRGAAPGCGQGVSPSFGLKARPPGGGSPSPVTCATPGLADGQKVRTGPDASRGRVLRLRSEPTKANPMQLLTAAQRAALLDNGSYAGDWVTTVC